MERVYEIGKTTITEKYLEETTNKILEVLKNEKQTYLVNKFVLENALNELGEMQIN